MGNYKNNIIELINEVKWIHLKGISKFSKNY